MSDLPQQGERESEHDLLDRLMNYRGTPGPEQGLIAQESVQELLALVSAEDARLLDLALVQGWSDPGCRTRACPPGSDAFASSLANG